MRVIMKYVDSQNERNLIVTADDFGLTDEINQGIVIAHRQGILRSTALLMNGLATGAALELRRQNPGLEIGAHLGIVEGYSLRGRKSTLTDDLSYFGGGICLHRGWPQFIAKYLKGQIDLGEIEEELDLQLSRMRSEIGPIAFANGTQHLHLLPGVLDIVLKLMNKYEIKWLRLPALSRTVPGSMRRIPYNWALRALGYRARRRAGLKGIGGAKYFAGFDVCGRLDAAAVCKILEGMPVGTMELMSHPGLDCPYLRENLPWGYRTFAWAGELAALISPAVAEVVARRQINLIQFKDLTH